MRKMHLLMALGLAMFCFVGCGKPADKKPSWTGAPTTNTPAPTGAAGEAAENMPKAKDAKADAPTNEAAPATQ